MFKKKKKKDGGNETNYTNAQLSIQHGKMFSFITG